MSDMVGKQLDAIEAQLEVLKAMVQGVRHTLARPTAREQERPASCVGYKPEDCARVSDDAALELGGMGGGVVTMMCRGCGEQMKR